MVHVMVQSARGWEEITKRVVMVPVIVHVGRYAISKEKKKKWGHNQHVCNVQDDPSVTSPPSLGATPMAQSGDDFIMFLFLDPGQHISHLEMLNTTQLGRSQLAPVTFEGDKSVLQLLHGGGEAVIAMDLRLE